MWYQNAYRRHLCDMHIDDWDDRFLSAFSPEEYFANLKRANIQSAMLYFQSHVGLCYYPTASGRMHKAFAGREDMMQKLAVRCRQNGIAVVGYYSLIYNTWAHDTFPAWRMVQENGMSRRAQNPVVRYGLCCPNNADYRAFVKRQIEETSNYFAFDGMFYDMLFWPHMCYCPNCQARWEREVGGALPQHEAVGSQIWRLHMQKRREWMGAFAQWVTDITKSYNPGVSVEHNCASAVLPDGTLCNAEEVNDACDYTGGDLYGGIYSQSFTCKFYRNITKNQPFEYMFSRCRPNLKKHTTTKPMDIMKAEVYLTAAHHGATLVIDAIDPVGTMDGRVYEEIGEILREEATYEPYFHGEMVEDVGVYYSLKSKYNRFGGQHTNHTCAVNAVKTLVQHHIPVGVTGGFCEHFAKHKVIVAPCLTEEDEYDNERLIRYVKDGGVLYLSGADNPTLTETLLGASVQGVTEETVTYLSPAREGEGVMPPFTKQYPLPFDSSAAVLEEVQGGKVLAYLTLPYTRRTEARFASIHSDPPGIATNKPGIVIKRYGAGTVIWSALPIENETMEEYRTIFLNCLYQAVPRKDFTVCSTAPKRVEIVSFRDDDCIYIGVVNLNEEEQAQIVPEFTVSLLSAQAPEAVVLCPEGTHIAHTYDGRRVSFQVPAFYDFQLFAVCCKG